MNRLSLTLRRFVAGNYTQGNPGVELIYTSHAQWPLPYDLHDASSKVERDSRPLTVSVLDSSFNPPTMAHLALARASHTSSLSGESPRACDAKLLLFSLKNADKSLKPSDATPEQRLEMMVLLAHELEMYGEQSGDQGSQNVAVGICQEPTFVSKSTALSPFLRARLAAFSPPSSAPVQLAFLLGFDTLERLFASRYYGSESAMKEALNTFLSPSGDGARVICARRTSGASYSPTESNVLDAAAEFINSGAIVLIDIGETEQALSSSEVRDSIGNTSQEWESKVPKAVSDYIKEHGLYKAYKRQG